MHLNNKGLNNLSVFTNKKNAFKSVYNLKSNDSFLVLKKGVKNGTTEVMLTILLKPFSKC